KRAADLGSILFGAVRRRTRNAVAWSKPGYEVSKRTLNPCDRQSARGGVGGEMERSAPQRGLLEVEGRQLAAVRELEQPARRIIGKRRSRSGEVVNVDRVASTEILELRAEVRRSADPRPEQCGVVDCEWASAQEVYRRRRAGRRGNLEDAAGAEVKCASARGVDRSCDIERSADRQAPVDGDIGDRVGAGERPWVAIVNAAC